MEKLSAVMRYNILANAEFLNPGESIKDRVALFVSDKKHIDCQIFLKYQQIQNIEKNTFSVLYFKDWIQNNNIYIDRCILNFNNYA